MNDWPDIVYCAGSVLDVLMMQAAFRGGGHHKTAVLIVLVWAVNVIIISLSHNINTVAL